MNKLFLWMMDLILFPPPSSLPPFEAFFSSCLCTKPILSSSYSYGFHFHKFTKTNINWVGKKKTQRKKEEKERQRVKVKVKVKVKGRRISCRYSLSLVLCCVPLSCVVLCCVFGARKVFV